MPGGKGCPGDVALSRSAVILRAVGKAEQPGSSWEGLLVGEGSPGKHTQNQALKPPRFTSNMWFVSFQTLKSP